MSLVSTTLPHEHPRQVSPNNWVNQSDQGVPALTWSNEQADALDIVHRTLLADDANEDRPCGMPLISGGLGT